MPFRVPTHIRIEPGCFSRLTECLEATGSGRTLLVSDAGLGRTPWPALAEQALNDGGIDYVLFDKVEENPTHTTVDNLAELARLEKVARVVGLGGGSVLDAAKAVAMLVHNPGYCTEYEGRNRYTNAPAPFIAIPTTCGTGSEVTWVSVITHAGKRRKMSVKGETMFPTRALVDADLLTTLPPHLVAYTGLDALTHAIEATTCRASNPVSDALAEKAVTLLLAYLRRAVADIEGDAEAREAVMRASTLAGLAFGNADVAAVHCLPETIGGGWNLPHGLCNAIFLAPVLRYQMDATENRLARLFNGISGEKGPVSAGAEAIVAAVEQLVEDLEIPPFSSFDIAPEAFPVIAAGAVANNSNPSNARPMGESDYLEILYTTSS